MAVATRKQLTRVGFTDKRKHKLIAAGGTPTMQQYFDAGFTPRQARTLKAGSLTMKKLLRGGFNRTQAQMMLQV